jgi:hypothetical protein
VNLTLVPRTELGRRAREHPGRAGVAADPRHGVAADPRHYFWGS